MPVQSIDLSAVTEANFNGSAVEQINLNGSGVWTKPASSLKLMTTLNLNSGSACAVITSASPQLGWLSVGGNIQVPDGYLIEWDTVVGGSNDNQRFLVVTGGEVYIGVYSYVIASGANVPNAEVLPTYRIRVQSNNDCGQNAVATSFANNTNDITLIAKITPSGLEPVGSASFSYYAEAQSVDMYGNPVTTWTYVDWEITSTTYKQRILNESQYSPTYACTTAWAGQPAWNWCYPLIFDSNDTVEQYFTFE